MEDEHHPVGSWGYRIETWKPALNLFLSLATNTNCLQENLIIFLCLSSLSLNVDPYVPSLFFHSAPTLQALYQAIQVPVSTTKI